MFNKSWRTSSIVTRLTITYSLALIFSFTLGAAVLYWGLTRAINRDLNLIVRDRVETVEHALTAADGLERLRVRGAPEWALRRTEKSFIKLVDLDANKVAILSPVEGDVNIEDFFVDLPETPDFTSIGQGRRIQTKTSGVLFGYTTVLPQTNSTHTNYRLSVVISATREDQILEQFRFSAMATLSIMTVLSILAGARLAKFSFKPLDAIIEKTRNIQVTKLGERINEENMPAELANLAGTLNGALDRLESSFERLSRFSSGIAHELRTPVTNIMVQIEVALNSNREVEEYKEVMFSVIEESRRLTKMIDKLLLLARTEYPEQSMQIENIDLGAEIANFVDFYKAMAEDNNLALDFNCPAGLQLWCDRSLFQRALSNLISNAINYTRENGKIKVNAYRNGSFICVSVTDTGIGIPPADLPRVFDRFYRVDPSRQTAKIDGFGLGLSIVQSVMRLHAGDVRIESELNKGTTVTLEFPQSPPSNRVSAMSRET